MAANRGTEAYDLSLFEPRPAKVVNLKTNKNSRKNSREEGPHNLFSTPLRPFALRLLRSRLWE